MTPAPNHSRADDRPGEPGGWRARRRGRAGARREDRQARTAWRPETPRRADLPTGVVVVLVVLVAGFALWSATHHHTRPVGHHRPAAAPVPPVIGPTAPPTRTTPPQSEPTGGQPPRVDPAGGTRPTGTAMPPHPVGAPDRRDATSVADHAALDACSYAWTESVTGAYARVTRWMAPVEASHWRPTAGDRAYWSGHVVPTHETVTCQVTAAALDGPDTATRRGVSVTLATVRTSGRTAERGMSSYAVLLDRRTDGTWQVTALTATG